MPRQLVISIPKWLYDQIKKYYLDHKEELEQQGIKSINALGTKLLQIDMEVLTGVYEDVREVVRRAFTVNSAGDD